MFAQGGEQRDAIQTMTSRGNFAGGQHGRVVGGLLLDQSFVEVEDNGANFQLKRRHRSHAENVGQDTRRMVARIDLVIHAFDLAVLVDEKAHAVGIPRFRIRACAVGDRDRMI
jgi:hypothetical protein